MNTSNELFRSIFACCLVAFLAFSTHALAVPSDQLIQTLQEDIPRLRTEYEVPGVAVSVIEAGETVWEEGFGYADLEQRQKVNPSSVFQVGRLSELVTAWGILSLVEEGKIDLDSPIGRHVNSWEFPPSDYDSSEVTIRRLLNHSAGIASLISAGYQQEERGPDLLAFLQGRTHLMGDVRLAYEPGTEFRYSAGGYALLQLVIEEVSVASFCDFMEAEILEPLGMHSSGFKCRQIDTSKAAASYTPQRRKLPRYQHTAQAAVGLRTTLKDFSAFVTAFMAGPEGEQPGRGLLSPELVREMYRPQGPAKDQYGLGCCLTPLKDGGYMIHQCCGMHGWRAQAAIVPDQERALVLFTNTPAGKLLIQEVFGIWCRTYNLSCVPCVKEGEISPAKATLINIVVTGVILVLMGFTVYMGWKARRKVTAG